MSVGDQLQLRREKQKMAIAKKRSKEFETHHEWLCYCQSST